MNIAIGLAAITALATTAGGFLAIKSKDRLHLVLGLSAGLLLGLVAFDLLPEVFELGTQEIFHAPAVSVALIAGFLLLHFYEQLFGSHEPAESDYGHDHKHSSNVAGALGALAMGGHVFLDGLALGVAFKVSTDLGIAVFIALLVHAFSDGLNTVSFLIKSGKWGRKGIWLLGVDAIARVSGAALGTTLVLGDNLIAIYAPSLRLKGHEDTVTKNIRRDLLYIIRGHKTLSFEERERSGAYPKRDARSWRTSPFDHSLESVGVSVPCRVYE
jgi:ZIP family zinc transporter